MKTTSSFFLGLAAALLSTASTQAQILADWTFETSLPTTAGPYSPEVGSGSATGSHAGAAVYSNPAGNGSSHSYSANVWAVNDYWQFQTSTTGQSGVSLSWDQTSSSTGPRDWSLSWSTDGTTFNSFATYSVLGNGVTPNPSWNASTASSVYSFFYDLSSVTALNNQASVYFRLTDTSTTSATGGTVATAGTDRVDNFVIAVPEPQLLSLCGGFGILALNLIRRRK